MDELKKMVAEVVDYFKENPELLEKFKKDPKAAVKEVVKDAVDDGQLDDLVKLVKGAITADNVADIAGKLKGLFDKD